MTTDPLPRDAARLLEPWPGPLGGLPPFDACTPAALEAACRAAIDRKRAEIRAIAEDPRPPSIANTVEALEGAGRALARVVPLLATFQNAMSTGDMPAVAQRLAPLLPALDDEVAHDERLFQRIDSVWRARHTAGLDDEQRRLVEVVHQRLLRRGAALPAEGKARLQAIHARLAELGTRYNQNLIHEADAHAVIVDDAAELDGLPQALVQQAANAAAAKGRPGAWAIVNARSAVWPTLTHAHHRSLRERVWRMWSERGNHAGPHDNKPLANEMLQLRGEKARLLGFSSFAHYALADRMAATPETAQALLERTWSAVRAKALQQCAEYQALADAERAGVTLAPWDRLYWADRIRRQRFGVDGTAVQAHLPLGTVLAMLFEVAGRVHGLQFHALPDAPRVHASVQVFEVRRAGGPVGVLYLDLINRPGKMHGSYQMVLRDAEHVRGPVLPISAIHSSLPPPPHGQPLLLQWEYANVLFHEFGHALHMLHNATRYPSLSSQQVAWDFVELPSMLNERWLLDRDMLARHARHHQTGAPMPAALVDSIEQALLHDRPFSLNPDFLLPAIVDLRWHLQADGSGRTADALALEQQALDELGLPACWDVIMRATHNVHVFAGGAYAAGLYSYLWADVMAADAAECFSTAPGGWYDPLVCRRWIDTVLSVGHRVPAAEAFRRFAGHEPDEGALLRRFGLEAAAS